MSMTKTGVVDGEGEAPPAEKQAEKCPDCGYAPGERGQGLTGGPPPKSTGTDPLSKTADAARDQSKKNRS